MNIKDLLSVSGLPGLYRSVATKKNGIVVESLETGQKRFLTTRSYQFSPLESIAVYTDTDTLPLDEVFAKMKAQPPEKEIGKDELRDYFSSVLPEHDREKVYTSDIKKIVSWFLYLDERGYLEADEENAGDDETITDEEE